MTHHVCHKEADEIRRLLGGNHAVRAPLGKQRPQCRRLHRFAEDCNALRPCLRSQARVLVGGDEYRRHVGTEALPQLDDCLDAIALIEVIVNEKAIELRARVGGGGKGLRQIRSLDDAAAPTAEQRRRSGDDGRLVVEAQDDGSSQPYALYWGSAAQLHSLSFDPQKAQCTIARTDTAIEITIELPSRTFQAGEDAIESAFFLNLHPAHQIQVGNAKATTFQLGDKIALATEGAKMCLEFHLEEGEGRFFGHISRANRPNQKGKNLKFEAFDWQIALRTICRSERCVLRVCLSI